MLKPTVGMELELWSALGPPVMGQRLRKAAESGQRWNTVAAGLRNTELDVDALDSKLSSLDARGQLKFAQA
jgi:hypothetical protein